MRVRIYSKIVLAALILPILFLNGFSQESPTENSDEASVLQAQTSGEVMSEEDRLPFMQKQQSATESEPGSMGLLVKTLGAMFLIIGLLFFGAWGLRKLGWGGLRDASSTDPFNLKVLSSLSVANGQTLSIVSFGEKVLLIGSTSQSFTLLADQTEMNELEFYAQPHSVADMLAEEPEPISFREQLSAVGQKYGIGQGKGGRL